MATKTTKKPKYSEKDFKNPFTAPCFGDFKPPKKSVKGTTSKKKGK